MQYRFLGNTGTKVSVISLGGWLTHGGHTGNEVAKQTMKAAYEAGVNFFDSVSTCVKPIGSLGSLTCICHVWFMALCRPKDTLEVGPRSSWVRPSKNSAGTVTISSFLPNCTGANTKMVPKASTASRKTLSLIRFPLADLETRSSSNVTIR
jgi:hypothetical protein